MIFESEDDFYHLQILKRKKEHEDLGSNSLVIKTYYIRSLQHLEKIMPELINSCDFNNARAYLNLNRRSFEKVAFHTLKKITDQILNKDFKSVRKAYENVCGTISNENNKKWIIDIDNDTYEGFDNLILVDIENSLPLNIDKNNKVYVKIPTKNGYHLITKPFDCQNFKYKYPKIDIQKDNPTLLYFKD